MIDPDLRQLPFAALQKPNSRHVVEDHPVIVTTSIRAFLIAQLRKTTRFHGLLSVGNPTCDRCDESLPPLNGAEAEAREVAGMYERRVMLVKGDATKERVIGALAYCDIAHFAVHANEGLTDTVAPYLLLAPARGDDRKLTTAEIAKLRLGGVRIVVLAGCRTAASSARKSGTQSLVDAFLVAGAGSVVGTLWEVEDAGTREMSILLHRALRNGATPAEALRAAQIEMIRRAASPRVWAALQLFGSGS